MYGWRMVVTRVSFYVYSSADLFVAGKILTKSALGAYGFAVSLATMLPEKILALVSSITPSIFSSVQAQEANLRRYLLSVTEGLSLVGNTWPRRRESGICVGRVRRKVAPDDCSDAGARRVCGVPIDCVSARESPQRHR
jgi:hypothetical protein